jgi:hypothetical protein
VDSRSDDGYFFSTSSSRNETTLLSIAVEAELSFRPDLGERWPSRLVATAAEESRAAFGMNCRVSGSAHQWVNNK